jgi:hypothetical protein
VVGRRIRNQSGRRGRATGGARVWVELVMRGLILVELFPELGQFGGAEVSENVAIDFDDGREGLAGELDHFLVGLFVADNVEGLVGDTAIIQPIHRFAAPRAIGLNEEPDLFGLVHGWRRGGFGQWISAEQFPEQGLHRFAPGVRVGARRGERAAVEGFWQPARCHDADETGQPSVTRAL